MHFLNFTDAEVRAMILVLSEKQMKIFQKELKEGKTQRHALFIAKSFSSEKDNCQ